MENLVRKPTESSPKLVFDGGTHTLEIRGSSYLENTAEFYAPVMLWMNRYLSGLRRNNRVRMDIELVYFNSSSSRVLMELFERLNDKAFHEGLVVDINWFYESEDEDMRDFGQEFHDDFQALAFRFSEIHREAGKKL